MMLRTHSHSKEPYVVVVQPPQLQLTLAHFPRLPDPAGQGHSLLPHAGIFACRSMVLDPRHIDAVPAGLHPGLCDRPVRRPLACNAWGCQEDITAICSGLPHDRWLKMLTASITCLSASGLKGVDGSHTRTSDPTSSTHQGDNTNPQTRSGNGYVRTGALPLRWMTA